MSKKNKIFVSCDEANHTCDKTQYKEATFWETIKLNIHLIYCRACRKYTSNNGKLTKMMKNSELEFLKSSEKDALKNNFQKELANHD